MVVPGILFFLSLIGLALTWQSQDLFLLAGLSALASLGLVLRGLVKGKRAGRASRAPKHAKRWIVVDGSNVMYWRDGEPKMKTVLEVVQHLSAQGFTPGVMFDANAGYLLEGRYRHDYALGKQLGLPADRVMVVPKAVPADPFILNAARDMGAQIVSNDRYRDWAEDYPEVNERGHLIRGGYRDGVLWLNLPAPTPKS